MLLAWRALKGFQAASFQGESSLSAIVFPRHPYVPFYSQLSYSYLLCWGCMYSHRSSLDWRNAEKYCYLHRMPGGVRHKDIDAPMAPKQVDDRDRRQTKAGCGGWLCGNLPQTLSSYRLFLSATSSRVIFPLCMPPQGCAKKRVTNRCQHIWDTGSVGNKVEKWTKDIQSAPEIK